MSDVRAYLPVTLVILFTAAGCGEPPAPVPEALEGVVESTGSVEVGEVWDPLTIVERDEGDRFLVIEPQRSVVRLYEQRGPRAEPITTITDVTAPISASRMADGRLVVASLLEQSLQYYGSTGMRVHSKREPELTRLWGAHALGPGRLLLAGLTSAALDSARLLHFYDLNSDSITKSFFDLPVSGPWARIARTKGSVAVDLRADSIAAVFAYSDHVHVFDSEGEPARVVPLNDTDLVKSRTLPELDEGASLRQWNPSHIFSLHWLSDGSYLIQYVVDPSSFSAFSWSLAHVGPEGQVRFERHDTPQLLAFRDGELLFRVGVPDSVTSVGTRLLEARLIQ